ncbi:hypothetical protein LOK49_Contig602G00002 [Camellia lanceoleosa]|nr:hypothetical protein LOK49_Contig602G00002 [Camellia lanceoleosa]
MSIAQVQYWVDEVEAHLKDFAKKRALLARRKEVRMGANNHSPGTEWTGIVVPIVSSVKIPIVSGDHVSPPKTGEVHPLRKTGTCGKVDAPSEALVGHLCESTNLEKKVLHGPPFNGPGVGVGLGSKWQPWNGIQQYGEETIENLPKEEVVKEKQRVSVESSRTSVSSSCSSTFSSVDCNKIAHPEPSSLGHSISLEPNSPLISGMLSRTQSPGKHMAYHSRLKRRE